MHTYVYTYTCIYIYIYRDTYIHTYTYTYMCVGDPLGSVTFEPLEAHCVRCPFRADANRGYHLEEPL